MMLRYLFLVSTFLFFTLSFAEEDIEIEKETLNLIADITFDDPTEVSPSGIKTLTRCCPDLPAGCLPDESHENALIQEKILGELSHEKDLVELDPEEDRFELPPASIMEDKVDCHDYKFNYDNIPVIELLRIISEISNTNFIFDSQDLNFTISIVSEESSNVNELLASLLQILRMHGLSVVEQGRSVLIFKNDTLAKVATVVTDDDYQRMEDIPIVTRVFRLFNLKPADIKAIVVPLLSKEAIVEASNETRHLIVSDITGNVEKIADLILALDRPNAESEVDVAQYKVKSAYPSALVAYAKQILTPLSPSNPPELIAQPSSSTIFIVATPYLINKTLQILNSLDTPTITPEVLVDLPSTDIANNKFQVYKLRYHDGNDVVEALRDIGVNLERTGLANMDLVSTINSIQWIRANNSIVFSGTEAAIERVLSLIEEIDTAPKQVYIEVLIIDTTLANSLNFGVQWVSLANEQNKLAFASGFLNPAPSTAPVGSLGLAEPPLYGGARNALNSPPPNAARGGTPGTGGDVPIGSGFNFGVVGNIIRHNGQSFLTLGALVSALETESDTTIILNPRIMTEDSKEANLFVGSNIPYQTTSTVVRDTGSVTENIQYEDVGVQLRVVPTVTPGNVVTLQLDQSISSVSSSTVTFQNTDGSTNLLLAPTTNKILTSTRFHVPDNAFIVMSGHVSDEIDYTRSGIPCLGSLPLIGPIFSNTTESRTKRNLILFLRPHVISNSQEIINFSNLEGYEFNWETDPCSIRVEPPVEAPEDQVYPPLKNY